MSSLWWMFYFLVIINSITISPTNPPNRNWQRMCLLFNELTFKSVNCVAVMCLWTSVCVLYVCAWVCLLQQLQFLAHWHYWGIFFCTSRFCRSLHCSMHLHKEKKKVGTKIPRGVLCFISLPFSAYRRLESVIIGALQIAHICRN